VITKAKQISHQRLHSQCLDSVTLSLLQQQLPTQVGSLQQLPMTNFQPPLSEALPAAMLLLLSRGSGMT
jgi:hypothetical protein